MDSEYDRKFADMKKYIPFLENMIRKLENTGTGNSNPRQAQLSKIKALRDLLLDQNKRMKMENLLKCEQVLVNLYAKVEHKEKASDSVSKPLSANPERPSDNLEIVRRKLKLAAQSQNVLTSDDTLPEIARADQIEIDCSPGSKEPALFQRRPNKIYPNTNDTFDISSDSGQIPSSKRNYTRVLVSPPRESSKHWQKTDEMRKSCDVLFHRRSPKDSPRRVSPAHSKKDKRSRSSKSGRKSSRSERKLNITLNVPEESLSSLNTEDIFDRIVNCDHTDVDIESLRSLRSQILTELKHTGANEDISDLILQSYRKKKKKMKQKSEIEEGEISESDSEVIESVYGSLVIVDKESEKETVLKPSSKHENVSEKDTESRKIQICLVISNAEKDKVTDASISNPETAITNTELSCQNTDKELHGENVPKPFIDPSDFDLSSEPAQNILLSPKETSSIISTTDRTQSVTPKTVSETLQELSISKNKLSNEDVNIQSELDNTSKNKLSNEDVNITSELDTLNDLESKKDNKANFYNPVNSSELSDQINSKEAADILKKTENNSIIMNPVSVEIPFLSDDTTCDLQKAGNKRNEIEVNNFQKESNKAEVSELDILQALKNEILGESLSLPGPESVTPSLHQPKISKVTNSQEVSKKKISLENYKKKTLSSNKPTNDVDVTLYGAKNDDKKPSRGLTAKEFQRFNLANVPLQDSSEDEKDLGDDISNDDIYGDLAPKSPDVEISDNNDLEFPVIIPEEPVKTSAFLSVSNADIDMRSLPSKSPIYKDSNNDTSLMVSIRSDNSLPRPTDPRRRIQNFNETINSPQLTNPGGTPRHFNLGYGMPNMTPVNMPSSRASEMTPSRQSFESEDMHPKHVYAPMTWDDQEKNLTKEVKDTSDNRKTFSRFPFDPYQQRARDPRLSCDRRDDVSGRLDCPTTPVHHFGRGDNKKTSVNTQGNAEEYAYSHQAYGRIEGSSTPIHPFGRNDGLTPNYQFRMDCPATPNHPFGRLDCPSTPIHPFGRNDCPTTPNHPFGRNDCPGTPNHPFGRTDHPSTPSHSFSRSENSLNTGFDRSRYNRNNFANEYERNYSRDNRHLSNNNNRNSSLDYENSNYSHSSNDSYSRYRADRYAENEQGRFSREQSFGRDRNRGEQSVGRNIESDYRRAREASVGRAREPSVGRGTDHGMRGRESSVGREHFSNITRGQEYSSGQEAKFVSGEIYKRNDLHETGSRGERFNRAPSVNRYDEDKINRTVSTESQQPLPFLINTSINSTFQNLNIEKGTNHEIKNNTIKTPVRDRKEIRALAMDTSNIGAKKFYTNKFSIGIERAKSGGREAEIDAEKGSKSSCKNLETNELSQNKLDKGYDQTEKSEIIETKVRSKSDNNSKDRKTYDNEKTTFSRDPRVKKDKSEENKPIKNMYSPRKNVRDPRLRRYEENKGSARTGILDKSKVGIIYTSDNIASGNILGSNKVKNFKIPKIKKPIEEVLDNADSKKTDAEEPQAADENQEKNYKIDNENLKEKELSETVVSEKHEIPSDESKKVTEDCRKVLSPKKLRKVLDVKDNGSPKRLRNRKNKKSMVYDSDSDDNIDTSFVHSNEKSDNPKLRRQNANNESRNTKENDDFEFEFDLQEEDVELFSENINTDNVIINDLIADLDKDIDTSKNTVSLGPIEKDTIFDSILESFSSVETSNLLSDNADETTKQKNVIPKLDNKTLIPDVPISETKNRTESLDIQKTNKIEEGNPEETLYSINSNKVILANVEGDSNEVGSTSTAEFEIIHVPKQPFIKNSVGNNEPCGPDSTINTEETDNELSSKDLDAKTAELTKTNTFTTTQTILNTVDTTQTNSNTVDTTQTEMNSAISSTHDSATTSKASTTASSNSIETVPRLDSLGSILSLLQDKSKIKELLGLLDDKTDSEKIKKTLEKLSEIVSDDEDVEPKKNSSNSEGKDSHVDESVQKEVISTDEKLEEKLVTTKESSEVELVIDKNEKSFTNCDENNMDIKKQESVFPSEENIVTETTIVCKGGKKNVGKRKKLKKNTKKCNSKVKRITRSEVKANMERKQNNKSRELQKLQEDIRNMFISNDVLNATGLRMCRLAKLVEDKNPMKSPDISPNKNNESGKSEDENENIASGPVVVLEKFCTKLMPNKNTKKVAQKSKSKKSLELDTESRKGKSAINLMYKPGPKSKKKLLNDPYEFESDSIGEAVKVSESTPYHSESDNESVSSFKSYDSPNEIVVEKKIKAKKKRGGWKTGVIKPKKSKKKTKETKEIKQTTVVVTPLPEQILPAQDCFTDIAYHFTRNIKKYPCRLCNYVGESIVSHYKSKHPHYEIPLSRMKQDIAQEAINQSMTTNFRELQTYAVVKYICRFCSMVFIRKNKPILETFFWHIVKNHTGEFKQICSDCSDTKQCDFMLDIPLPPVEENGILMGYICGKCNFTQVSLENLKKHVSLRHNDEETEVYTISLGIITYKPVKKDLTPTKIVHTEDIPRSLRNLRSNNVTTNEDTSDSHKKETNADFPKSPIKLLRTRSVQSKLTFETESIDCNSSPLKIENSEGNDLQDSSDQTSALDDSFEEDLPLNQIALNEKSIQSNDVYVYPHFKIKYTSSGTKEYQCCINGDHHYVTTLMITLKKHVMRIHSNDKWDGYCSVCKVIVMPQGIYSFKDCLIHLLDKHIEDFPVLDTIDEKVKTVNATTEKTTIKQHDSPKTYINVRPMSELISVTGSVSDTESVLEDNTPQDIASIAFPKIENVISLNTTNIIQTDLQKEEVETPKHDQLVYEEAQKEVMSKKYRIILDSMLSQEKLAHVFKCSGSYCSFTCASAEDALIHVSTHRRLCESGTDTLKCAYCSFDASSNAIDLVSHVFKEHGSCGFSCSACFYRACNSNLIEVHYARTHGPLKQGTVLKSPFVTSISGSENENILSRQDAVKSFICASDESGRCKFKTFTSGKFFEHLVQKHPGVTAHRCNECEFLTSAEELLKHLQGHGLQLYQCTWCVFGTATETEMLSHASINHPSKRPQAYVRHIIESQDGTTAKFKVLPVVLITKKEGYITPIDVPSSSKNENPVREAERALDLENLIEQTFAMIEKPKEVTPTPPLIITKSDNAEIDRPETINEVFINKEPMLSPALKSLQAESAPSQVLVSPEIQKQDIKTESSVKKASNVSLENVVYCIDSDDEEPASGNVTNDKVESIITESVNTDKVLPAEPENIRRNVAQLFKCPKCQIILKSSIGLKRHFRSTCYPNELDVIPCAYCSFRNTSKDSLLSHYVVEHSNKYVYTCSVCKEANSFEVTKNHMETVHNIKLVTVRIEKKTPDQTFYVLEETQKSVPKSRPKRKRSSNEPPKAPPAKVIRYGPLDINLLPINQIFDEPAQCSLCEFSTKVRQNMIRHLQLHEQHQAVPQIAPVNPVPHLETNEMHFDKMQNLASSSNTNKQNRTDTEVQVTTYISPESGTRYPKYVPSRQRFACGAKDCSYISINEVMLKCHWETLHSGSNVYHCVHCPLNQQLDTSRPLTALRILGHLKMHDVKLYGCSECPYYHYQENIIKKHFAEKHKGKAQLKLVREATPASSIPPPVNIPQTPTTTAPTMDLKPWHCGLCSYKTMLHPEMVDHCAKNHNSKFQFKCSFCPWRSSAIENVNKHHSNSHPGREGDVFYFYYREGSISDEIDGVPKWMKQRSKVGLPIEPSVKEESNPVSTPLPSTPVLPSPRATSSDSTSVNLNIVKKEVDSEPLNLNSLESLCNKFGQFCEPNGIKYKCPFCKIVTEDSKEAMQSHLFEELKYRKWGCSICNYKAFHKIGLKEHAFQEHRQNLEPIELPSNTETETWVIGLLEHQEKLIENSLQNFQKQKILVPEKLSESPKVLTSQDINKKIPEESAKKLTMEELEKAFGSFGEPVNLTYSCPKCNFKVKEEVKMRDHLEIELNKVRWCCSLCSSKFQSYHEAQLHCKHVQLHGGQIAKTVEAIRDSSVRSDWIDAVVKVQKLSMKVLPISSLPEPVTAPSEKEPENSLLMVRYEENIPIPEQILPTTSKRPSLGETESDDERLVIDEELKKAKDSSNAEIKCQFCSFKTIFKKSLIDHLFRHYNMKPYKCFYCDYKGYKQSLFKHLDKEHPNRLRQYSKNELPSGPPLVYELKREPFQKGKNIKLTPGKNVTTGDEFVCLLCGFVFENEFLAEVHKHPSSNYKVISKVGSQLIKCNICHALRTNTREIKSHYDSTHPNKLQDLSLQDLDLSQYNTNYLCQEIGCNQMFPCFESFCAHKYAMHGRRGLLKVQKTIDFRQWRPPTTSVLSSSDNESEIVETNKRKLEDATVPEAKRVAKKSTTKLPNISYVAKKSTTKLPLITEDDIDEYSYYGTKPESLNKYVNIKTTMSLSNSTSLPVSLKMLHEIVNINPKVIVKDIKEL